MREITKRYDCTKLDQHYLQILVNELIEAGHLVEFNVYKAAEVNLTKLFIKTSLVK